MPPPPCVLKESRKATSSSFYLMGSGEGVHVFRLGSSPLYTLNHLASYLPCFLRPSERGLGDSAVLVGPRDLPFSRSGVRGTGPHNDN